MPSPNKVTVEVPDGPELLLMPKESELGIFEQFLHPEQEYGWLRDRIKIFQQEGPGGGEPVPVQVNGFRCDIPREVECDVARPFVEVLRNSVETRMEYRELENGKRETVSRDVPRWHWAMIKEAVNRDELKSRAKKYIDQENAKRMAAWEKAQKHGDNP